MTPLTRQKDVGFATGAEQGSLWRGKGKIQQYEPATKRFRLELKRRVITTKITPCKQSLPKLKIRQEADCSVNENLQHGCLR